MSTCLSSTEERVIKKEADISNNIDADELRKYGILYHPFYQCYRVRVSGGGVKLSSAEIETVRRHATRQVDVFLEIPPSRIEELVEVLCQGREVDDLYSGMEVSI